MPRFKRPKIRHILIGLVALVVILFFGSLSWYFVSLRPVSSDTSKVNYTLIPGTKVDRIGRQLKATGLIRSPSAFVIYVTIHRLRRELEAGSYDFSPSQSTPSIASALASGKIAANRLVVPDGATLAQIKFLIQQHGISTDELNQALTASYSNDFLQTRPPGLDLEGYLFPDTYQLAKPLNAHNIVQMMLDDFGRRTSQTDIAQGFSAEGLNFHQGITLASIVEKEVPGDTDRAMVAQVYLNRLKAGKPLEADPTVAYAASILGTSFSTNVDSPYNTYANKGLPPGPICSPSLSAMEAAAHPSPNDYMYFIADKQGHTHFARTYAEHQANVQKYLR